MTRKRRDLDAERRDLTAAAERLLEGSLGTTWRPSLLAHDQGGGLDAPDVDFWYGKRTERVTAVRWWS